MNECHPCIRSILLPIYPLDSQHSKRALNPIIFRRSTAEPDPLVNPSISAGGSALPSPLRLSDSHILEAQGSAVPDLAEGFQSTAHHLWSGLAVVAGPS